MPRRAAALALGLMLVCLTLAASPAHAAPEDFIEACSNGIAVPDPEDHPGLVQDCAVLLSIRDTLAGDATLDWSEAVPIVYAGSPHGAWEGIRVDLRFDRVLGSSKRVTGIDLVGPFLEGGPLTGTLPPELAELEYLEKLRLPSNRLTGSIPASIGSLHRLEILRLDGSSLTGSIPPEIMNLSRLRILFLTGLSGQIPRDIGRLTNLESLWLGSHLTGTIPDSIGDLSRLKDLNLRANKLTGSIPESIGKLSRLQQLKLDVNSLSGSIPETIGGLVRVERINLWRNQITGSLPPEIGGLGRLVYLHIGENFLIGNIPDEIGNLKSIRQLILTGNQLSGKIPGSIGNLSFLWNLKLNDNLLEGDIPADIGRLSRLQNLELSGNILSGQIPLQIMNLELLSFVALAGNNFEGCIPVSLKGTLYQPFLSDFLLNAPYCTSVEVRVWQDVADAGNVYLSVRPQGGSWRTLGTVALEMRRLSESRRYRYSDRSVEVPLEEAVAEVDVRVWQEVTDARALFISAREGSDSWRSVGTLVLDMSGLSDSGRYRYGDITLAVNLGR